MGNASYNHVDWSAHVKSAYAGKSRYDIFTRSGMDPALDPSKFKYREAVDSTANPQTTPIILAVDETGSMGHLAEVIIKEGLGTIMNALYNRKPVTDPQILCAGVGDAEVDEAPIQVTQFEADGVNLSKQVEKIYIEGNGGGNDGESYPLAWFFAGYKTKCDAIRKRKRKGYLFTIGDEAPLLRLTKDHVDRFFGLDAQADMQAKVLLADVSKDWEIFHLIVKPVDHQPVEKAWHDLLGPRAIRVQDHNRLAEGIVAVIETCEGRSSKDVVKGWTGDSAIIVRDVNQQLTRA